MCRHHPKLPSHAFSPRWLASLMDVCDVLAAPPLDFMKTQNIPTTQKMFFNIFFFFSFSQAACELSLESERVSECLKIMSINEHIRAADGLVDADEYDDARSDAST